MRKILPITLLVLISVLSLQAQDEGAAVAQQRFRYNKGIYLAGGPALTLGKNLGDYSNGMSFEAGFLKRLNKVVSIGPNISYLSFKYDESKTYPYYYDSFNDEAIEVFMTGGDISLISAGCNFKLNFVPVGDETKFSFYGIANPFVSYVSRKEFTGSGDFYTDGDEDGIYDDFEGSVDFGPEEVPEFEKDNKFSGGLHLGLGFEVMPMNSVSFFFQATISYTLPVKYAATESFLKEEDKYVDANNRVYYEADNTVYLDQFPIVNKGFSALSLKAGISFNIK